MMSELLLSPEIEHFAPKSPDLGALGAPDRSRQLLKMTRKIGKKCNQVKISTVLTIGNETIATDDEIDHSIIHKHFDNKDDLLSSLKNIVNNGDNYFFIQPPPKTLYPSLSFE